MATPEIIKDMLDNAVHIGYKRQFWSPKMRDYIYGDSIDVSCLSNIHYLKLGTKAEPTINLIFRASDIKHELFPDIILVYWFFIKPVFKDRSVNLNVFASTSQNIDAFKHTLHILHNVISNTTEKLHK